MTWPWKREEAATAIAVETEAEQVERQYQESKVRYHAASEREREYQLSHSIPPELFIRDGKAYVPINATERSDPVHDGLKKQKEHERQEFCRALAERSEWRKRMGLVR